MPDSEPKLLSSLRDRITGFKRVPAKEVLGSDFNFRTHGTAQQRAVEESLAARGIYEPLLTYKDSAGATKLADGHLRQSLINAKVGPDTLIPIIETDLTEEEAKSVLLVHDPLSAMAGVDKAKLDALMRECQAAGAQNAKLLEQMAKDNKIDWSTVAAQNPAITAGNKSIEIVEDEVPEPPKEPVTKPGDLWLLGVYWECDTCGKRYEYAEGQSMNERCPCG